MIFPSTVPTVGEINGEIALVVSSSRMVFYTTALNQQESVWAPLEPISCDSTVYFGANIIDWNGRAVVGYHRSDGGVFGGHHGVSLQLEP